MSLYYVIERLLQIDHFSSVKLRWEDVPSRNGWLSSVEHVFHYSMRETMNVLSGNVDATDEDATHLQ
jgi:hypothetical protein